MLLGIIKCIWQQKNYYNNIYICLFNLSIIVRILLSSWSLPPTCPTVPWRPGVDKCVMAVQWLIVHMLVPRPPVCYVFFHFAHNNVWMQQKKEPGRRPRDNVTESSCYHKVVVDVSNLWEWVHHASCVGELSPVKSDSSASDPAGIVTEEKAGKIGMLFHLPQSPSWDLVQ